MKVVLFCGGLGLRLREYSEEVPKPMVPIGPRPILWHVMKYYAHFGHKDFILCLGWQGKVIKDYFRKYDECASNDFVLDGGQISLMKSDIHDWRITFVDTGLSSSIGQRLQAVQPFLAGEAEFLANYSDGLSDVPLPAMIDFARERDAILTCLTVHPRQSFHLLKSNGDGMATGMIPISSADLWMNGGFFVLRQEIFDYLQPSEDLMAEPALRLIDEGRMHSYHYEGFWGCMDTYKEKKLLEDLYSSGRATWEVWKQHPDNPASNDQLLGEVFASNGGVLPKPR